MGSSRTHSLNVDERVTRSGVYNFHVQGSVCHRMGALLPPLNRRPMFAQVYINDPDMEARVASRMGMTEGLDPAILEKIDQAMTAHNGYTQQFLNARRILLDRRTKQPWNARPGDNPALRLNEFLPRDEDLRLRLHVARNANPGTYNVPTAFEVAAIIIDRAAAEHVASVIACERQLVAGEARPGDNPALRLNEFLPRDEDLRLRLHVARNANPGTYNVPTAFEVAAIIIDRAAAEHRDIILNTHQGGFKRIFETSESYDPLQYPLLFPYGEPGWTYDLPYVGSPVDSNGKPLTMSLREYESYVLHDRTASNSLILRGGRLTQQYCVDQWTKCEQERLRFIEKNQLQYRLETLQGLTDALRNESVDVHRVAANEEVAQRGSTATMRQSRDTGVDSTEPEAENIGRKVIIPPTFTGGPRYMYQRFLDAMAMVRETGAPNLFITMTCNPNWPEIKENLRPGEKASDRPDIVARVFMQKPKTLNKDLDEGLLGIVAARVHVVEYQKRGLPHAHILLIMRPEDKPVTAEDVDRLMSAELPDQATHPELYETVISNISQTIMAEDKYPTYRRRRRPEGILSHKGKVWDNAKINQWVVPYNPFLSQKYDCHINVEVCATNKAVKYIYKYVYKGSDMTTITIEGEEIQANEILQYLGRYISPVEACMRLFGFPTQRSSHAVVNLPIHLEGMSLVTY
ncbi:Helitron helicase-like protein [Phytophthora palmivora]|uniref:Helitron helicase-like protein n=1 Tax=Phytophthora palmivora TaxID=4796 RepID=A0A2P4YQS8_9STRA|nr:Helitron helicase-like protein [Phytophthora palmivora]